MPDFDRSAPAHFALASIHDVGPRFESEVDRLADALAPRTGASGFALLVVPNHWGTAPLRQSAALGRKLRGWVAGGAEIFVHGWFHRDDEAGRGGVSGFKARHMTAGEGEFGGLDEAEALRRMRDGRALIEDVVGAPAAGFIAPAWLYSEGARRAAASACFQLAEDHFRVWHPPTGMTLARGPVITWASRSWPRTASSLLFAAIARGALAPMPLVRVAVHPGDTSKPEIMRSIDRTFAGLGATRRFGRYADLLVRS